MYEQKLFSLKDLRNCFEAIEPELIRFPSLDADALRGKIEALPARVCLANTKMPAYQASQSEVCKVSKPIT
jgi:hypothetical protein